MSDYHNQTDYTYTPPERKASYFAVIITLAGVVAMGVIYFILNTLSNT